METAQSAPSVVSFRHSMPPEGCGAEAPMTAAGREWSGLE
eukprot:CAMPEP_0197929418 /NCGR_PEP_ID=MMETSP1439-20131203/103785_1 /TAXON_ID=66791 /ORGANISM="Gonyaulax spinifera, Strain CCMP409" /LENGTH=39 /DNA_ID= /DNA_START= /DNA_END= /DNA_ORIENTATION=